MKTEGGIWRGTADRPHRITWDYDQFDPVVVKAVARMVTKIPVAQRSNATRVSRWLTYLMNNE
eukprot:9280482-Heterocapsa_arctica.AAC.1